MIADKSSVFRWAAWYALFVIVFRCPSDPAELGDNSPRVCKPYLTARTYLTPHVTPYYKTYAAPYVDAARPYINTLDQKVVTPTVDFGKRTYHTYGAAHVDRARQYGEHQWQQSVRPRIEVVKAHAGQRYNTTVAPHVVRATDNLSPYYETARQQVLKTYHGHLLPAYVLSLPYAQQAYNFGQTVVVQKGSMYLGSAWRTTSSLINRTIWPRVKILYGENVEPQVARIGERLGRYRDRKKLQAAVQDIDR